MAQNVRPVVRAHSSAPEERSTLSIRRPRFYELALPVIGAEADDDEDQPYPPRDAKLKLTSQGGYERSIEVSSGARTEGGFCAFRFDDIDESYKDDLFTATLEWEDEEEIIFEDKKVATFVVAAKEEGDYEPPFGPGPEDATAEQLSDDSTLTEDDEVDEDDGADEDPKEADNDQATQIESLWDREETQPG